MSHSRSIIAPTVVLAAGLLVLGPAPAASQTGKPPEVKTVGPPAPLGEGQLRDLQAKRQRDAAATPAPEARVKPAPAPADEVPALPTAVFGPPPKPPVWKTVSPRLGPVPRPEWQCPQCQQKLPDVTVSRPLPAAIAPAPAAGARAGGQP